MIDDHNYKTGCFLLDPSFKHPTNQHRKKSNFLESPCLSVFLSGKCAASSIRALSTYPLSMNKEGGRTKNMAVEGHEIYHTAILPHIYLLPWTDLTGGL